MEKGLHSSDRTRRQSIRIGLLLDSVFLPLKPWPTAAPSLLPIAEEYVISRLTA